MQRQREVFLATDDANVGFLGNDHPAARGFELPSRVFLVATV
jgi:hypothetical protein